MLNICNIFFDHYNLMQVEERLGWELSCMEFPLLCKSETQSISWLSDVTQLASYTTPYSLYHKTLTSLIHTHVTLSQHL